MSAERDEHRQRVLAAYQATRRLPSIAAGVLEGGALVWTGTNGPWGAERDRLPAGPDVHYRIGSITKTLTAVLVMQCRDDGLLDLDDAVGRFVPESGYRDATLRQLLAHTSGMQSEPVGPWWERTPGGTWSALNAANDGSGAVGRPGERYHYSNLGFAILGEVVARLRGEAWWPTLRGRVLDPLGMARTSYAPEPPMAPGFSVHHLRGTLTPEPHHDSGAMAPAGQLWSTVGDLAVLGRFLVRGHPSVLSLETVREMAAPVSGDYGLGMFNLPSRRGHLVGHLGSMPGYQACLLVEPTSGDGVIALTNATTGLVADELAEMLLGDRTPAETQPWVPSVAVPGWAEELLGTWYWGNSAYEARWHNNLLELHDVVRGRLAERFARWQDRIIGVAPTGPVGYHAGETLHVVRRDDGTLSHLECATFVYTRVPYDPAVPIPGGHPPQ